MSKKLLGSGDLIVLRETAVRGVWIAPKEMRDVSGTVGEVAYLLYSYYRTFPFREGSELQDEAVGEMIGWVPRKVTRYRKVLEKSGMVLTIRYGTKQDGVTKLFVGADTVALYNAGLPPDIINHKALEKLKKELSILDTAGLIKNAAKIVSLYELNPDKYN